MQVLRNAGTRVKLLIARDIAKDSQLSSPAISQDSLDGNLSVCVHIFHLKHLSTTMLSLAIVDSLAFLFALLS